LVCFETLQDGIPELVFATYGDPNVRSSGYLVGLDVNGNVVFDIPLPNPGTNGNGNGAPAAPTIADINGDGQLEILVQTFDHGIFTKHTLNTLNTHTLSYCLFVHLMRRINLLK
jgi:hypothetical protein